MNEKKLVDAFIISLLLFSVILTTSRIMDYRYSDRVVVYEIELPELLDVDNIDRIVAREAHCLAQNIYHEARNQSKRGQLAVASVTMNRVHDPDFPDDVCSVVYQRNWRGCQFSWLCKNRSVSTENHLYKKTYKTSKKILMGEIELEDLDNALFYHADYVRPWWARHKQYVTKIETHIFYK